MRLLAICSLWWAGHHARQSTTTVAPIVSATTTVRSTCKLPLDAPSPLRHSPFRITIEEDRLAINCFWIGAKLDFTSAFYAIQGTFECNNSTGKWTTVAGYEAPLYMSCIDIRNSDYSWPEYCNLFDEQDNGSRQLLSVFQGSEDYCPHGSLLQLADGTDIGAIRCMGRGANFRVKFLNGTSTDMYVPITKCLPLQSDYRIQQYLRYQKLRNIT